jgi:hypothetical protein
MKLVNLIVPAALLAGLAVFVPNANAQTMGEYATATAGAASSGGSMGTSIGSTIGSDDFGSRTWGASSLGGSFEDRAGANSRTGGDFESRAGSSSGSASASRWPASRLSGGDSTNRFGGSTSRFPTADRFTEHSELSSSSDRFPASHFNDNKMGLDTHYSSSSGLDTHYNSVNY